MNKRIQTILSAAALAGTTLLSSQTLKSQSPTASNIVALSNHPVAISYGQPVQPRHRRTIDMSRYISSSQREEDPVQFHLAGYMECFGGECAKNNEPAYSKSGFSKTYWRTTTDGVRRFVNMKGSRSPSEFFSIRGDGIYLEEEVMTWNPYSNNEFRDHHTPNGAPNNFWSQLNAVADEFISPDIGDFFWRYCDKSQPDEQVVFHDGGHFILGPYNLTRDSIRDIERDLAPYGTGIERGWLLLNQALGRPEQDVELTVRVNYWSPFSDSRGKTLNDWREQETYWYIKDVGFVRWNQGEHLNPQDPIFISKQGTLDTVVLEPKGQPLRALELCEVLAKSAFTSEPTQPWGTRAYIRARESQRH